jgi:hypothetical protein
LAVGAGLGIEFVHEVYNVEEPPALAASNTGPGDADGKVRFAGSSPAVNGGLKAGHAAAQNQASGAAASAMTRPLAP